LKPHPQLAVVAALRATAAATVPAILQAHPAVAADRLSTNIDAAADNVVRLAERLRSALDAYRSILLHDSEADPF
jgi:hypothetical protein